MLSLSTELTQGVTPQTDFRNAVANTVKKLGLNEANWKNEDWKGLWTLVNQEVLNDAFDQHGKIREVFSDLGRIDTRKCKTITRIENKIKTEKEMAVKYETKENGFKIVSDFVAVRIPCNVTEIKDKIDRIKTAVDKENGQMYVRGSSDQRPYGFFMSPENNYTDITQYVYVFLDKVGYPIEFQIGHEFASHTFTIDSEIRDNPTCGKVDLWTKDSNGKSFYGYVSQNLLNKANNQPNDVTKEDLLEKAKVLHAGNVPQELESILNKI